MYIGYYKCDTAGFRVRKMQYCPQETFQLIGHRVVTRYMPILYKYAVD